MSEIRREKTEVEGVDSIYMVLLRHVESLDSSERLGVAARAQAFLNEREVNSVRAKVMFPEFAVMCLAAEYPQPIVNDELTPYERECQRVDETGGYYQGIC